MIGQKFGRLTVIGTATPHPGTRPKRRWLCRCDCGNEVAAVEERLKCGHKRSCGCLHIEATIAKGHANRRHGQIESPEYQSWRAMRYRCSNPRSKDFARYGGRGITVSERWQSFENFIADMGRQPSPEHTLDRIDGTKGYSPDNCRWATPVEQTQNSRVPKLTIDSVRAILRDDRPYPEIARTYGVSVPNICMIKTRQTWRHVEV